MKICLISLNGLDSHLQTPRGNPGGAERQTALLAEGLAALGATVSCVVTDYDEAARRLPRATQIPLLHAYSQTAGVPGLRFFHPRWTGLRAALRSADADLYYQRGAGAVTGQTGRFVRRAGRRFVFGVSSDTDTEPARLRLNPRDRRLYRYGLRAAHGVVAQHAGQQQALARHYGLSARVIGSIVPHLPQPPSDHRSEPMVLWLGNFRRLKRHEWFLQMARRFPRTRFVLVGGINRAEPAVFARAQQEAAGLDNVTLAGPVADPRPYLAQAAVLLNTSELEGFPSSFVEAWAHGVPTVATVDPGGVATKEGLGLYARDLAGVETALRQLLEDADLRRELGARAHAYAAREHGPEAVSLLYLNYFKEVIAAT